MWLIAGQVLHLQQLQMLTSLVIQWLLLWNGLCCSVRVVKRTWYFIISCSWHVTTTPLYFADNGMFGEGVLWWVCLFSLDQDKPVQDLISESGVEQNFSCYTSVTNVWRKNSLKGMTAHKHLWGEDMLTNTLGLHARWSHVNLQHRPCAVLVCKVHSETFWLM